MDYTSSVRCMAMDYSPCYKGTIDTPMSTSKTAFKQMAPEEFKSEILRKGWTYRALAERWSVTDNWISKIARNENRPLHWDDAVRGLPVIMKS